MAWLPSGEKSWRTYLAVSTEYRRVTDGRTDILTDGQTSCDGIVHAVKTKSPISYHRTETCASYTDMINLITDSNYCKKNVISQ